MAGPTIEEAIISQLLADATVKAAPPAGVGQEVRGRFNQSQTFPRIRIGRNDGQRPGALNQQRRLALCFAMIQVDGFANDPSAYTSLKVLMNYVGTILDRYQGLMGGAGHQVFVQGIFELHDPDDILPPVHADEVGVPTCTQLYRVAYTENT